VSSAFVLERQHSHGVVAGSCGDGWMRRTKTSGLLGCDRVIGPGRGTYTPAVAVATKTRAGGRRPTPRQLGCELLLAQNGKSAPHATAPIRCPFFLPPAPRGSCLWRRPNPTPRRLRPRRRRPELGPQGSGGREPPPSRPRRVSAAASVRAVPEFLLRHRRRSGRPQEP
jgi:hypothetical protein